jgi:hypothetical protein
MWAIFSAYEPRLTMARKGSYQWIMMMGSNKEKAPSSTGQLKVNRKRL